MATTYSYKITISSAICPGDIPALEIPLTIEVTTNCDPVAYIAPILPSETLVFEIDSADPSATKTRTIQDWTQGTCKYPETVSMSPSKTWITLDTNTKIVTVRKSSDIAQLSLSFTFTVYSYLTSTTTPAPYFGDPTTNEKYTFKVQILQALCEDTETYSLNVPVLSGPPFIAV